MQRAASLASLFALLLAPLVASPTSAQDLRIRVQVEGADNISAPRPAGAPAAEEPAQPQPQAAAVQAAPAQAAPAQAAPAPAAAAPPQPAEGTVLAVPPMYGQLPGVPQVQLRGPRLLDPAIVAEWHALEQRYRRARLGGPMTMLILGANMTWIGGWLSALFSWTDDCWDCEDDGPNPGELGFAMFASVGASLFITGAISIIRRVRHRRRVRREMQQFRQEHGIIAHAW